MTRYIRSEHLERIEEDGSIYFLHSATGNIMDISPGLVQVLDFLTAARTEADLSGFIQKQNLDKSPDEMAGQTKEVIGLLNQYSLARTVK